MNTQQDNMKIISLGGITLKSNSILDGCGMIIKIHGDKSFIDATNIDSAIIKNLTIQYVATKALTHDAIQLTNSTNITFDNINISVCSSGVQPSNNNTNTPSAIHCFYCEDIVIKNSQIRFGINRNIVHPGTGEITRAYGNGIMFYHVTRGEIVNNKISSCSTGVFNKLTEYIIVRDNTISDIHRWSPDDFGKGGCGILFSPGYDSTIEGNYIKDCEEHGIYLSGADRNMLIRNNIQKCAANGIQLNKGNGKYLEVEHNIITDNICNDNGMSGIALLRYAYNNICRHNICVENGRKSVQQSHGSSYFPSEEWSKGNKIGYNVSK